ncbi:MAG: APC family permease [Actinomycetia bacterium]|nr:APC family permease [Actinomycetes bacterium]
MPHRLHHSRRGKALGLPELVAIGVGGMIGGGIFSILGIGAQIAGHGVVVALALGGLVALFSGYSYVRLAGTFPTDGASYTYVSRAWSQHPEFGALTGWTVILGYVGTLGLYAFTFGAYGADLVGFGGNDVFRLFLSAGVLVLFLAVNLAGARATGTAEDLVVYTKIAILGVFAVAGLIATRESAGIPRFEEGAGSVFMAGAMIFVAYEGFQLITNAVEETDDPQRNVPRGVYASIAIVTAIYVVLAYVAVTALPVEKLVEAKEYALAVVAQPVLGEAGTILVALAALLATSSAINSTMFGASRMMADMGDDRTMPGAFARRNRAQVPYAAVVALTSLGLVLTLFGSLEVIASFSSMTFLLVSLLVSVANLQLRRQTGARASIVVAGIILMTITIVLLWVYLAMNDPATLGLVALLYVVSFGAERSYAVWRSRNRLQH